MGSLTRATTKSTLPLHAPPPHRALCPDGTGPLRPLRLPPRAGPRPQGERARQSGRARQGGRPQESGSRQSRERQPARAHRRERHRLGRRQGPRPRDSSRTFSPQARAHARGQAHPSATHQLAAPRDRGDVVGSRLPDRRRQGGPRARHGAGAREHQRAQGSPGRRLGEVPEDQRRERAEPARQADGGGQRGRAPQSAWTEKAHRRRRAKVLRREQRLGEIRPQGTDHAGLAPRDRRGTARTQAARGRGHPRAARGRFRSRKEEVARGRRCLRRVPAWRNLQAGGRLQRSSSSSTRRAQAAHVAATWVSSTSVR